MKVCHKSDKGTIMRQNDDSFYVNKNLGLFMVADGLGGYEGGEIASQIAVDTISDYLHCNNNFNLNNINKLIFDAIYLAHEKIKARAKVDKNLSKMGTTITMALHLLDKFYIANVGDSRVYQIKENDIVQISEDQSLANDLYKKGIISKDELQKKKFKNVIIYALGKNDIKINYKEINWEKGTYLLLTTDGLTDALTDQEILNIIKQSGNIQNKCENLVQQAIKKGEKDNITIILLHRT